MRIVHRRSQRQRAASQKAEAIPDSPRSQSSLLTTDASESTDGTLSTSSDHGTQVSEQQIHAHVLDSPDSSGLDGQGAAVDLQVVEQQSDDCGLVADRRSWADVKDDDDDLEPSMYTDRLACDFFDNQEAGIRTPSEMDFDIGALRSLPECPVAEDPAFTSFLIPVGLPMHWISFDSVTSYEPEGCPEASTADEGADNADISGHSPGAAWVPAGERRSFKSTVNEAVAAAECHRRALLCASAQASADMIQGASTEVQCPSSMPAVCWIATEGCMLPAQADGADLEDSFSAVPSSGYLHCPADTTAELDMPVDAASDAATSMLPALSQEALASGSGFPSVETADADGSRSCCPLEKVLEEAEVFKWQADEALLARWEAASRALWNKNKWEAGWFLGSKQVAEGEAGEALSSDFWIPIFVDGDMPGTFVQEGVTDGVFFDDYFTDACQVSDMVFLEDGGFSLQAGDRREEWSDDAQSSGTENIISHSSVPKNVDWSEHRTETQENTTFMIHNVPNEYTRTILIDQLDWAGLYGKFDFIYLPIDRHTKQNVGYAFINFVDSKAAEEGVNILSGHEMSRVRKRPNRVNFQKVWVSLAHLQGLEKNVEHYKNTSSKPLIRVNERWTDMLSK